MTAAERACDEIDLMLNELVDEYVDGDQLRRAIKALQLARDLVGDIDEAAATEGDDYTDLRDDLNQRARDAVIALRASGYWT